ncbi:40624_t:CDS:2 [Gigaspora margarita]|uniref:40624_t:CDS:1 n=1 Tax=Gigaspora margarita TaxID=4874 RepID=A0ABN7WQ56_GIGMA|nr:40624_t:CDS:2 [Gigaspora margarita]
MARLVAEIESFLLTASLEAICSGSIFYLTMNGDEVGEYNTIRNLTERAIRSMENGYNTIIGLKALKALNINQESSLDFTQEEIANNIRILKMKLSSPMSDADENLYGAIKKSIDENLDISKPTWRDPIASTVLSDEMDIIKNLKNMKCTVPRSIFSRIDEFVKNFNKVNTPTYIRNMIHNKAWKEKIWCNPAFSTSTARNMQSKGTYITDVIIPLLRATFGDLPNGTICLSSAERQSFASKVRRNKKNDKTDKEKIGKKPDIMALESCNGKLLEYLYLENGISYINSACKPLSNQFGVVGIQISGEKIYLNVPANDTNGIPRYFHLDHAEIPLTSEVTSRTKPLIRLLLTLRNIIIVNKNLLMQAMYLAILHPPKNARSSPTVTSPPPSLH